MNDVVAEILCPRLVAAWVLGLSGLAGLLLAVVGVYSVVSYSVAQQLRDVGIRSTLGASHGDIIALFLGQGTKTLALAIPHSARRSANEESHGHARSQGNPQARNLFDVIAHVQWAEGLRVELLLNG